MRGGAAFCLHVFRPLNGWANWGHPLFHPCPPTLRLPFPLDAPTEPRRLPLASHKQRYTVAGPPDTTPKKAWRVVIRLPDVGMVKAVATLFGGVVTPCSIQV